MNNEEKVTGNDGLEIFDADVADAGQVTATVEIPPQGSPSAEGAAKNTSRSRSNKATGPRTERGKQFSSRNAIKHAIFAAVVLPGKESRTNYQALVNDLVQALQPVGALEEMLVHKLAALFWRYRRLLVAEGAEINRTRGTIDLGTSVETALAIPDPGEELEKGIIRWAVKCLDSSLLHWVIEVLNELREKIKKEGLDWERDRETIERLFGVVRQYQAVQRPGGRKSDLVEIGREPQGLLAKKYQALASADRNQPVPNPSSNSSVGSVQPILDILNDEIRDLTPLVNVFRDRDLIWKHWADLAALVPSHEAAERLQRYEAMLERSIDRTLGQLERLQRMRRGQPVPPTVKVELSG